MEEEQKEPSAASVDLKGLEEALDSAVFVEGRFPLVVDPSGQARRFLQYQRGEMLHVLNKDHMTKANLRDVLVRCLRHGATMSINFGETEHSLESFFEPGFFPKEVCQPAMCCEESFWRPLLQDGDEDDGEFQALSTFKLVAITKSMEFKGAPLFVPIHVRDSVSEKKKAKLRESSGVSVEALAVADVLGVKDVQRNSKDLVEAAFEGNLVGVKEWIEKGYFHDSADGRGHTALSEAACKGHVEIVDFLLDEGADPNSASDQGRTPLYRAAFQGELAVCEALLEGGADPRLRTGEELPEHVGNSEEVKSLLREWDTAKTDQLCEMRRKELEQKMEERLKTAAERAAYGRMQIAKELVALAEAGDEPALCEMLDQMVNEAFSNQERPRGKAEVRDDHGNTLLMIAAIKGHLSIVDKLLTAYHDFDPEFEKTERTVWYANVNSRNARGWNATSLATFHQHKAVLELLLSKGGDPCAKNFWQKSAVDFAKDTKDACHKIVEDRSEIRAVIVAWDDKRRAQKRGLSEIAADAGGSVCGATAAEDTPGTTAVAATAAEAEEDRCTLFDEPPEPEPAEVTAAAVAAAQQGAGSKDGKKDKPKKGKGKGAKGAPKKEKKAGASAAGSGAKAARTLSPGSKKKT